MGVFIPSDVMVKLTAQQYSRPRRRATLEPTPELRTLDDYQHIRCSFILFLKTPLPALCLLIVTILVQCILSRRGM